MSYTQAQRRTRVTVQINEEQRKVLLIRAAATGRDLNEYVNYLIHGVASYSPDAYITMRTPEEFAKDKFEKEQLKKLLLKQTLEVEVNESGKQTVPLGENPNF